MLIQQIRNATLKIEYGGIVFLVDPWLQAMGTGPSVECVRAEMQGVKCPLDELPVRPESIVESVDCCLVTHIHFDHFCPDHLPDDMRIITQNSSDEEAVRKMGFQKAECFGSDQKTIGDVKIFRTKAVHGDNEAVIEDMGTVSGYILESPGGKTLYIASDTVYCEEVEKR